MKPKFVAVIESNERGVQKWLADGGLRPDRHTIKLLPVVEYFDPVDDLHGMLTTGGIRVTVKPNAKRATIKRGAMATGYCMGGGRKAGASARFGRAQCRYCKKGVSVNADGTYRKHKVKP